MVESFTSQDFIQEQCLLCAERFGFKSIVIHTKRTSFIWKWWFFQTGKCDAIYWIWFPQISNIYLIIISWIVWYSICNVETKPKIVEINERKCFVCWCQMPIAYIEFTNPWLKDRDSALWLSSQYPGFRKLLYS